MKTKRIQLLATPRNISTALMYSFAQRKDTTVLDEPLYAHYLIKSGALHPGRDETIASMENDGTSVVNNVILGEYNRPYLFIKNMTHHLIDVNLDFMNQTTNFMLIRDPHDMLISYSKVNPNPTMTDIGIKMQFELYQNLIRQNNIAILADAMSILTSPTEMLAQICEKLEIPFDGNMLHWPSGARKEDGVWAKFWYGNVHRSTGFQPYKKKQEKLPEYLQVLYEEALPYYQYLFDRSLKTN